MPDPHLTQQLARMGARIIFHAVNGGRNGGAWSEVAWRYHASNLRMRARAGGLWIVTVDNCHPTDIPCSAPSGIIDPEGNWVCRTASKGKAYFTYALEL
jgi:predicted amidohydrolase